MNFIGRQLVKGSIKANRAKENLAGFHKGNSTRLVVETVLFIDCFRLTWEIIVQTGGLCLDFADF